MRPERAKRHPCSFVGIGVGMCQSGYKQGSSKAALGLFIALSLPLAGCSWSSHHNNFARKTVFDEVVNADVSVPVGRRVAEEPYRERQGKATILGTLGFSASKSQPIEVKARPRSQGIITGSTSAKRTQVNALQHAELRPTQDGEGFELNFKDADLQDVARVILFDTLRVPYVYDAKVVGKVTFSTGRPVGRDELLSIFETILQMNGAVMVRQGKRYQIVPAAEFKARGGLSIDYSEDARQVGPGYGLTIFPLRHAPSTMVLKLMQSFNGRTKALSAVSVGNLIFIRGTAHERRTLMEIASSFDVDWLSQQSVGIYPLSSATPAEIVEELEQVFRAKRGQIGNGTIRFRAIQRLNAVLVLSDEDNLLERAARWVRRLDRSNEAGRDIHYYQLEHAKAVDVAKLLNQAFGSGGDSSDSRPATDEVSPGSSADTVESKDDGEDSSEDRSNSSDSDSSDAGSSSASVVPTSGPVRVVPDKQKNALIIRAQGRDYKKVVSVIEQLDRPPAQVLINATLAEVSLNDNIRFGVQFFLQESGVGSFGFSGNTNSLTIQPSVPGLNLIGGSAATPKVVLDALSQRTSVRVISSPSVVAVNNKVASLQVGDEVPITTRQAQSVTDPAAPIVNNIEFRETGVILKVKPRINRNGDVQMTITQEVSNVANQNGVGNAATSLTPTISQKKIASTINVKSGQMVVLGGLISETQSDSRSRIPLWEHIPLFGDVPGRSDGGINRTELVVFIRPTVIRSGEDAMDIAYELQDRLRSLAPPSQFAYKPIRSKSELRKQEQLILNKR